jgi:hypothetical protein
MAAVAIVNQESRWRSIPGAAFHDLLRGPVRCRMPRHCNVEDLPVRKPDDEEDVKRPEQDLSGHRKSRKPTCSMHAASGTLATPAHIFGHSLGANAKGWLDKSSSVRNQ